MPGFLYWEAGHSFFAAQEYRIDRTCFDHSRIRPHSFASSVNGSKQPGRSLPAAGFWRSPWFDFWRNEAPSQFACWKLDPDRFATDSVLKSKESISEIHQLPIQDFYPDQNYDFIISGLPLNNFPAELVDEIASKYFQLLKPGGVLSYFEYMFVRPIRKVVTRGLEKNRIRRIDEIMQGHCSRHRIARDNIWVNVPPAWVQHLQLAKD